MQHGRYEFPVPLYPGSTKHLLVAALPTSRPYYPLHGQRTCCSRRAPAGLPSRVRRGGTSIPYYPFMGSARAARVGRQLVSPVASGVEGKGHHRTICPVTCSTVLGSGRPKPLLATALFALRRLKTTGSYNDTLGLSSEPLHTKHVAYKCALTVQFWPVLLTLRRVSSRDPQTTT